MSDSARLEFLRDRIEGLEAEVAEMTERVLCGESAISGCHTTIALLVAELAGLRETTPLTPVTDEDAIQILRGYWRNAGARFGDAEIKHMVELLEAFVARKLKARPTDSERAK